MVYLFKKWDELKDKLKDRFLFIFLDFDGTLAPITETPAKAELSSQTRRILASLSKKSSCKIAVISGRSLEDVKAKFRGLNNIIYSGNHGLEIEGPKIKFRSSLSSGYSMAIKTIKGILQEKLGAFKGVLLEDKGFSLSLHYRLVDAQQIPGVKRIFHETVIPYLVGSKIKINEGKKVLEVRPALAWDKGKVVLWLLARQRFVSYNRKVVPIYIGDDLTDEDAFKALKRTGVTIFVGKTAKASNAQYYLEDISEVPRLLRDILKIQS